MARDRHGKKWTEKEDRMLVELLEKGDGFLTVADKLNRSSGGCRRRFEKIEKGEVYPFGGEYERIDVRDEISFQKCAYAKKFYVPRSDRPRCLYCDLPMKGAYGLRFGFGTRRESKWIHIGCVEKLLSELRDVYEENHRFFREKNAENMAKLLRDSE